MDVFGYSRHEIIGNYPWNIVPLENRGVVKQEIFEILSGKKGSSGLWKGSNYLKNGSLVKCNVCWCTIEIDDNPCIYFVAGIAKRHYSLDKDFPIVEYNQY